MRTGFSCPFASAVQVQSEARRGYKKTPKKPRQRKKIFPENSKSDKSQKGYARQGRTGRGHANDTAASGQVTARHKKTTSAKKTKIPSLVAGSQPHFAKKEITASQSAGLQTASFGKAPVHRQLDGTHRVRRSATDCGTIPPSGIEPDMWDPPHHPLMLGPGMALGQSHRTEPGAAKPAEKHTNRKIAKQPQNEKKRQKAPFERGPASPAVAALPDASDDATRSSAVFPTSSALASNSCDILKQS